MENTARLSPKRDCRICFIFNAVAAVVVEASAVVVAVGANLSSSYPCQKY
jgi:hypothetical protein